MMRVKWRVNGGKTRASGEKAGAPTTMVSRQRKSGENVEKRKWEIGTQ